MSTCLLKRVIVFVFLEPVLLKVGKNLLIHFPFFCRLATMPDRARLASSHKETALLPPPPPSFLEHISFYS
jgi:hypothetical protein